MNITPESYATLRAPREVQDGDGHSIDLYPGEILAFLGGAGDGALHPSDYTPCTLCWVSSYPGEGDVAFPLLFSELILVDSLEGREVLLIDDVYHGDEFFPMGSIFTVEHSYLVNGDPVHLCVAGSSKEGGEVREGEQSGEVMASAGDQLGSEAEKLTEVEGDHLDTTDALGELPQRIPSPGDGVDVVDEEVPLGTRVVLPNAVVNLSEDELERLSADQLP